LKSKIFWQVLLAPLAIFGHRIKRPPRGVVEDRLVNPIEAILDPERQRTIHLPTTLFPKGFSDVLVGLFHRGGSLTDGSEPSNGGVTARSLARVTMHPSNDECDSKHNDDQQEAKETAFPITAKRICTPSELAVTKPEILSLPEVSLKRGDTRAALSQCVQCLRVPGAEPGTEPVLPDQTNGDAHEQTNA
jgi:hypothetical protein